MNACVCANLSRYRDVAGRKYCLLQTQRHLFPFCVLVKACIFFGGGVYFFRVFFIGPWKEQKMVIEILEKSLNFASQSVYEPWISNRSGFAFGWVSRHYLPLGLSPIIFCGSRSFLFCSSKREQENSEKYNSWNLHLFWNSVCGFWNGQCFYN